MASASPAAERIAGQQSRPSGEASFTVFGGTTERADEAPNERNAHTRTDRPGGAHRGDHRRAASGVGRP